VNLVFASAFKSNAVYHLEVWKTRTILIDGETKQLSAQVGEPISARTSDGRLELALDELHSSEADSLGLVIVRMDAHEETETTGAYSIVLSAD
jgi:hypothetical protein